MSDESITLQFGDDNRQFLYRTAGVALNGDLVLLQRIGEANFWCLPGGRMEMGESAADGVRREIREESGFDCDVGRLLWIVENFYNDANGARIHEIGLYFLVRFDPVSAMNAYKSEWKGQEEDGTELTFRWWPVDDLGRVNLQPEYFKRALRKVPDAPEYVVNVT
ncbi:MAG TPA: NUDIX domain-containing protein [Dehalococcoidia bacterium]|nr:NUDIX domain-containing protein [Dehalococcoidia bacterium]